MERNSSSPDPRFATRFVTVIEFLKAPLRWKDNDLSLSRGDIDSVRNCTHHILHSWSLAAYQSTCSPCRTGSEIGGDYRFLAATGVATMSWRNGDRLRRLLSRCSMAVGGASTMMTAPLPTLLAISLCLCSQRRVRRTRTTLSPSHDQSTLSV